MADQIIKLEEISKQLQTIIKAMKSVPDASTKMSNDVQKSTDKIKTAFKSAKKEVDSFDESFDEASNTSGKFKEKATQVKDSLTGMLKEISGSTIAMLGLGGGMLSLVTSSFHIIQSLGSLADSLRELSSDTGSASKAVGTLYTAWGTSLGNMNQLTSAMHSLNNAGVPLGKQFTELTSLMGDLDQMTGIASDSWGQFTGSLAFNFKATTQDIRDITSAVISSGLKGQQMQVVMESISKAVEHVGYSAKDSKEMVKSLAQSISASVGVFQKLGVSAQSATQFLDKMIDPNEFQNNAQLFARLGISADDFFKSMESGQGSMDLMNKMMTNLPDLANKLASIQNPFQRFNIAKQMGLPMEMVSKLAGKTKDEIQDMMKVQMEKAKSDEALKKKKEEAKANQERFNEMLEMLKMQALAPIMALVSKHLPTFVKILTSLANLANSFFTILSPLFDKLATGLGEIATYLVEGANKFLSAIRTGNLDGFIQYLLNGFKRGIDWFATKGIPIVIDFLKQGVKSLFQFAAKNPLTTGTALIGGLLAKKFFGEKGTRFNPMIVEVVKGGIEGLKDMFGGLKKLPELFKGTGGNIGKIAARGVSMLAPSALPVAAGSAEGIAAGTGALSAIGPALAAIAPVALPLIAGLAAVAGGFVAASNAAEYFGKTQLTDQEESELESLRLKKKFEEKLSEADQKHYDELLKKQEAGQVSIQEKFASFLAGAGTFGIAPLIDKIFGTDITASIAHWINDEFKPELDQVKQEFTFLGKLWNAQMIEFKRWFYQYIEPAFKGLIQYWKGLIQIFSALFSFNWDRFKKGFLNIVFGLGKTLLNTLLAIFGDFVDYLKSAFDELITGDSAFAKIVQKALGIDAADQRSALLRKSSRENATIAQNILNQAEGASDANVAFSTANNAQQYIDRVSDAPRRAALQKILDSFKDAAIKKNQEDREKYEEEKKSREQANALAGAAVAELKEVNDQLKNRSQSKTITAQMLNPFAVSQIRFF